MTKMYHKYYNLFLRKFFPVDIAIACNSVCIGVSHTISLGRWEKVA